jgi:hypothetical protein
MPALMFHDSDANPIRSNGTEIDYVGKSWHERAPGVRLKHHPTSGGCGNPKHQSFKFVNKLPSQSRASVLVKIANFLKLSLDAG